MAGIKTYELSSGTIAIVPDGISARPRLVSANPFVQGGTVTDAATRFRKLADDIEAASAEMQKEAVRAWG